VDPEPVHELRVVRLDGLDRELEADRDLLVGLPLRDELQDLALPRRQRGLLR
jgi:hypothetical protein